MPTATKKDGKKLGSVIDKLYAFDQQIHGVEAELRKLKEKRALTERKLIRSMQDIKLERAAGRKAQAGIEKRRIPTIKNQLKFQKYVMKHKAFDLYQNRVASRAYFARIEEGEPVPGIGIYEKVSVSIRKRG